MSDDEYEDYGPPPPADYFGDPATAPRMPLRGDARREHPIVHEENVGPWHGEVTVTPIVRLDRAAFFEIAAAWGPGPNGQDVPGLTGLPTHRAVDVAAVGDAEGAERVARAAVDALRAPASGRLPPVSVTALCRLHGVALVRQV
jgi:hypothetical protein